MSLTGRLTHNHDEAAWELVKENAAPLQRGRNVSSLGKSLALSSKLSNKVKDDDSDIKMYESLVQSSENFAKECLEILKFRGEQSLDPETINELSAKYNLIEGDPLSPWLQYIKYHDEAYPADTHSQFLLMERCTRAFFNFPRFAGDPRYIRVCVLYADRTCNPNETFISFHRNKIGLNTSIFWLAWAWLAEKKEDFAFAEKIFRKAISKKAQPSNIIDIRYKQFQRRMSRHFLRSAESIENGNNDDDNLNAGSRRVLGAISEEGVKFNQRSSGFNLARSGHGQNHQLSSSSAIPFGGTNQKPNALSIHVDSYHDESDLDSSSLRDSGIGLITTERDKCKENNLNAERWNERGGLKAALTADRDSSENGPTLVQRWTDNVSSSRSAGVGPFAVFVDEEFSSKSTHDADSGRNSSSKTNESAKRMRSEFEKVSIIFFSMNEPIPNDLITVYRLFISLLRVVCQRFDRIAWPYTSVS